MDSSGKLTYYELILAVQINEDILNLLFCYKTKKKRLFWGNLINWAVKYSSNDGRVGVLGDDEGEEEYGRRLVARECFTVKLGFQKMKMRLVWEKKTRKS